MTAPTTIRALYTQQLGRGLRGRLVHAQRARKLRRRGEAVQFAGWSSGGKAKYRWMRLPQILDYEPQPRAEPIPESAAECEFGDEEYQWRLRQAGF